MSNELVARVERVIEADLATVWEAISSGAEIGRWFIQADFEPVVGYAYTFTHEDTRITGVVKRCEPPNVLEYTWNVSGLDGETTVLWRLAAVDAGTRVEIAHTGIESLGDAAQMMMSKFAGGWEQALDGLTELLVVTAE